MPYRRMFLTPEKVAIARRGWQMRAGRRVTTSTLTFTDLPAKAPDDPVTDIAGEVRFGAGPKVDSRSRHRHHQRDRAQIPPTGRLIAARWKASAPVTEPS